MVPLNSRTCWSASVASDRGAVLLLGRRSVVRVARSTPSTCRVRVPASASKTPARWCSRPVQSSGTVQFAVIHCPAEWMKNSRVRPFCFSAYWVSPLARIGW
ncbi:hypothetical protein STENM223S_06457 [Streptomyces tendae]